MRSNPNRFLHATLCFENLSSGENLAGCADSVGFPSGPVFCSLSRGKRKRAAGGEFRDDDEFSIEIKMVFRCVFQQREKKTRQNRAFATYTHRENDVLIYIKFSYLERVHALPVLVQVVHEIHDDDVKKQRISAEQSFVRKFCAKKVGCLSNETHVLHFFICVLREKSSVFC